MGLYEGVNMKIINNSNSTYKLLDVEDGYKYEQIGNKIIKRPDSNAKGPLTNLDLPEKLYAEYVGEVGKGKFIINGDLDNDWIMESDDLKLKVKLTSYKHIGVFPEQSIHWNLVKEKIQATNKPVKVLNLFAYTGAASINAALAGASEVVHVEALKQLNNWAKENSELNNTTDANIRYMQDDVISFLKREIKRGNKYQIIIMDPPSFGRGPKNQIWKFENNIDELLDLCSQLLEDPITVIISTYTNGYNKQKLESTLKRHFKKGTVETYNMFLQSETKKRLFCGTGGVIDF